MRPQVRGREVDALLRQGGVDAELAQLGVGLQPADGRHRLQVDLARRVARPTGRSASPGQPSSSQRRSIS